MPHAPPISSGPPLTPKLNLVEIMEAIDTENREFRWKEEKEEEEKEEKQKEKEYKASELPLSPQIEPTQVAMDTLKSGVSLAAQSRRGFVDFSSSERREEKERVARRSRRRGEVREEGTRSYFICPCLFFFPSFILSLSP